MTHLIGTAEGRIRCKVLLFVAVTVIAWGYSPAFAQQPAPTAIYWAEQHSEHPAWGDPTIERFVWRNPIGAISPLRLDGHPALENVEGGLTVDSGNGKVYYFTYHFLTGLRRLIERNVDGTSPREVLRCLYPCAWYPQQLKFEPTSGQLYIFAIQGIFRVNPAAASPTADPVYTSDSIYIITGDIDQTNGDLIFLDHFAAGFKAVRFDGSNVRTLGAGCPQHRCFPGFAVDGAARRLYYSKYGAGDLVRVYSQNYDGTDNQEMYGPFAGASQHSVNGLAIDFSTRTLYIAHGREAFGQGLDTAALYGDAPFWNRNAYNAALSATPTYLSLGTMVAGPPPDSTPPAITASVSGTLGNNGWYTSNVSVTWSATDSDSTVSSTTGCDPSSVTADTTGVTFTCSATSGGGTASQSITVKRDASAPAITVPANITTVATSASGAVVTYSTTASDTTAGVASSSCAPASGSTFAVGTSVVTCTAADNAGNASTGTFQVTVRGAADLLGDLAALVSSVNGPGNSLAAKVRSARSYFDAGNNAMCADSLRALLNEVRAQTGKKLTAAQSAAITTLTNQILALL